MIDNDLKRKLMEFTQHTQFNLLPFEKQKIKGEPFSKHFWCQDWWDIEVAKCLFQGLDIYPEDHPKRLIGNKNFEIESIKTVAKSKMDMMKKDDMGDVLVLKDCGRGLDAVLLSHVKTFQKIICHDENDAYEPLVVAHLGNKLKLNVKFTTKLPNIERKS